MELVLLFFLFLIITAKGLTNGSSLTEELDKLYYIDEIVSSTPSKEEIPLQQVPKQTIPQEPIQSTPNSKINKVNIDKGLLESMQNISVNVGSDVFDKYKYN